MPGTGVYPNGIFIPFYAPSPSFDAEYPFRGVIHTTESSEFNPSSTSYYGHTSAPHFTVARKSNGVKVYQHFSTNNGSRALKNADGGVQTNRGGAIQIEIAWRAATIGNLPDAMKAALRSLIDWISIQKQIQKVSPSYFPENQAVGSGAISRMSFQTWKSFNGWCGHQHVPENDHWDPGLIDIDSLLQ